jgi:hypothetical protein
MANEFVAKNGLISNGNITANGSIIANSFSGSLYGTSSAANSSSYALTASYAANGGGASLSTGSTYPITSSWSNNSLTASYVENGPDVNITSDSGNINFNVFPTYNSYTAPGISLITNNVERFKVNVNTDASGEHADIFFLSSASFIGPGYEGYMGNVFGMHVKNMNISEDNRMFVWRIKDPASAYSDTVGQDSGSYTVFENRRDPNSSDIGYGVYANFLMCDQNGNVGLGNLTDASDDHGIFPPAKVSIYGSGPTSPYPIFNVINYVSSNTSYFLINNDGKIGINNTSPSYTLDINGDLGNSATSGFLINGTDNHFSGFNTFGDTYHHDYNWCNEFIQSPTYGNPGFVAKFISSDNATSGMGIITADNTNGLFLGAGRFNLSSIGVNDTFAQVGIADGSVSKFCFLDGFGKVSNLLHISCSVISGSVFTGVAATSVSASFAFTASFVRNSISASYVTGSVHNSTNPALSASYAVSASFAPTNTNITASWSINAVTASYITASNVVGNVSSASYALSASYAPVNTNITASWAANALTASYVNPLNQTFILSGSMITTGSNTLIGNTTLTGSITISSSLGVTNPTVKIYGDVQHNGYIRFDPVTTNINNAISASYIYVSGSTNDLYFSQNGSGYSNTTRLRWLEGNLYTGILHGGVISSVPNSTTFTVMSGSGIIVNLNAFTGSSPFPTIKYITWNTQTYPITYSGSAKITYVGVDNTGTVIQQTSAWGSVDTNQWDNQIYLGVVLHLSGSVSTGTYNSPQISYGNFQQTDDFLRAFGPLKISGHTLLASGSGTTLSVTKTGGVSYKIGGNYVVNPNHPSTIVENSITSSKIYRYYLSGSVPIIDTGVGNAGYTNIDNTQYVNTATGQLAGVTGGQYTLQRVFWVPNSPTNAFIVYYGNAKYNSLIDAVNAIQTEPFSEAPNTALNAILVAYIAINGGSGVSLNNTSQANIIQAGLFRNVGGQGGGSTTVSTALSALSDVALSNLTKGDLLVYGSTGGSQWNNTKILSGSYGLSGSLVTDSGTSIGNGIITTTISASSITASIFSGSFSGSHYGTSSFSITASYALTSSYGITSSYSLSSSYALNSVSASYYQLPSQISVTGISGSFTGSHIGNTVGTASWATNAITASYITSSNIIGIVTSASFATSASWSPVQISGSWASSSFSSSYALSASNSLTASYITASRVVGTIISASYALTASYAASANATLTTGASYNITSSWATSSLTASYLTPSNSYTVTNFSASGVIDSKGIHNYGQCILDNITGLGSNVFQLKMSGGNGVCDFHTIDGGSCQIQFTDDTDGNSWTVGMNPGYYSDQRFVFRQSQMGDAIIIGRDMKVGIQTLGLPNYELDVNGSLNIESANIYCGSGNDTLTINTADGRILFGGFGTVSTIDSNTGVPLALNSNNTQNVGIRIASPAYALDVDGDINFTGVFRYNGNPYTASNALTASYLIGTIPSASYALSASFTTTASYVKNAITASYVTSSNIIGIVTSASYALSASWSPVPVSSSYSITSSFATTSSYYGGNILNVQLPPQINVTGVSASFTGSHIGNTIGTASWANNALTASYITSSAINGVIANAVSSSYFSGSSITSSNIYFTGNIYKNNAPLVIAGLVLSSSFIGSPFYYSASISGMLDTNYAISVTGVDSRAWSYSAKTTSGFVINSNSSQPLTGEVSWQVIHI